MKTLAVLQNRNERLADALAAALGDCGVSVFVLEAPYAPPPNAPDVVVVSADFAPRQACAGLHCRALLLPDGGADCGADAGELVTYGFSPRATLTVSSARDGRYIVNLAREVVTLGGEIVEIGEFEMPGADADTALAALGASLLLGLPRDGRAYIASSMP